MSSNHRTGFGATGVALLFAAAQGSMLARIDHRYIFNAKLPVRLFFAYSRVEVFLKFGHTMMGGGGGSLTDHTGPVHTSKIVYVCQVHFPFSFDVF